jgi:hypothetical protein
MAGRGRLLGAITLATSMLNSMTMEILWAVIPTGDSRYTLIQACFITITSRALLK